ncbi:MAG: Tm-1-like ATP-binding domain-containing protein [Deltaproteobacteria bacterium]|nr:Tm-1-like ATP-binding domain-containing protein [Deltaproteobacteria bacterium]
MPIAIIGMLDEREEGLTLLKACIDEKGHKATLIDISIGTGAISPSLKADISCEEIAKAGGGSIEEVRRMPAKERNKATSIMAEGLKNTLLRIHETGGLKGVIAVAGMTGSLITLPSMRSLPFGMPKVLITSVAAMPANAKGLSEFFGVRDITVMHSVVDTVGMNIFVRTLMINGANAICGMVENLGPAQGDKKPSIAITEFGYCDMGAHYIRELLQEKYEIISFHATGIGEKAAVDYVRQGLFEAFIDLVPGGFSEYLLGGNRATGPDRLDAGCNTGKPYILSPCGFDIIGCGPIQRKDQGDPLWTSRKLAERKINVQDAIRVQARTNPEEMRLIAREMAGKLNGHPNKRLVKIIIPTRGFSSLSIEEGPLYDPESDKAFIDELDKRLDPEIELIKVQAHINTKDFARAVVEALNKASLG